MAAQVGVNPFTAPPLSWLVYMAVALLGVLLLSVLSDLASRRGAGPRGRPMVLWVKGPTEAELVKARVTRTGEILVEKGSDVWVYKPPADYKPIDLRVGGRSFKAYLVDYNVHAFYEIPELREEELEQEVEVQGRKVRLNRVMLDPRTLYSYIGSKSMEKLIRPLRVGKAEAVGYMAVGGIMVLMMIFFLLPMMGYQVTIGG